MKTAFALTSLVLAVTSAQAAELTLECRSTRNEVIAKTTIEVLDALADYEGMAYSKVTKSLTKATPKVKSFSESDNLQEPGKPIVELVNHGAKLDQFDLNVTVVEYAADDEDGGLDSDGVRVSLNVIDIYQVTDWHQTTRGSFPKTVNAPQKGDTLFAEYLVVNPLSDGSRLKVICEVL